MNNRKMTIVKAVLLNNEGVACGFSKPLTSEELTGNVPIAIEVDAEIDLRSATVDFATPAGVLKASSVDFCRSVAFPGYTVNIYRRRG